MKPVDTQERLQLLFQILLPASEHARAVIEGNMHLFSGTDTEDSTIFKAREAWGACRRCKLPQIKSELHRAGCPWSAQ